MFRSLCVPGVVVAVAVSFLVIGCGEKGAQPTASNDQGSDEEAKVAASLAKLSPHDRSLAEAQKFCAVENNSRLGSMGTPLKLMLKDQPVFVCCKGCRTRALADPDKTLAKLENLRNKAQAESAKH